MIKVLPLDGQVEAIVDRLKHARSRQDVEICVDMITATPSTRWQYLLDLEEMAPVQRSALFDVLHQRRDGVVDAIAEGEVIYVHDYSESEVRERYPRYRSQNHRVLTAGRYRPAVVASQKARASGSVQAP